MKSFLNFFLYEVAVFLKENIYCNHGYFKKLVVDRPSKNKNFVHKLAERYEIKY